MKQHALREYLTDALAKQYGDRNDLQQFNAGTRYVFAAATIEAAWPTVTELGIQQDGSHGLLITPTETSNILNCAIGTDQNVELHGGSGGTAQTGTLVNGVCAVAISHLVGGELIDINPFGFKRPLPIGESAIITMMLPTQWRSRARIPMQGYIASTRQLLFKPATISLVNIPPR